MSAHLDPIFESPLGGLSHEGDISIHDLTKRHRWGLRGKGAAEALRIQGWDLPEQPNRLVASTNQSIVMALSQREFWVLDPHNDAADIAMGNDFTTDAYPLFCQSSHAWLVLKGSETSALMAKLCSVDLRPDAFNLGDVAQTQMALINCIIARHDLAGDDVFSIFVDQSYAEYAQEALLDARQEFL